MARISINSVLTLSPNRGELVFTATGDCELNAVYNEYQFNADATQTLSLNANFIAPSNTCLRTKICYYPVAVYESADDAFASSEVASGAFDHTEEYLEIDQSEGAESWIAFKFSIALNGQHAINWAIIQLPIVSGSVNSVFTAYAQSSFPVDISAVSDDNGSVTSQDRSKWVELDVTEIVRGAIDNVSETSSTGDVFIACRCVPAEAGSAARLSSTRNTTLAKPRLIIQPAE